MLDIVFKEENLVPKSGWHFPNGGSFSGGILKLPPRSFCEIQLGALSASNYYKICCKAPTPDERYIPAILLCLSLYYKGNTGASPGITQNITHTVHTEVIEHIDAVPNIGCVDASFRISNSGDTEISLSNIGIYASQKDVNQIVEVVEEKVIAVETMHALLAWVSTLAVDRVETNIEAKLPRAPYEPYREYITIKERNIDFMESSLSENELEQLHINVDNVDTPIWWTAINDHPQAYKYFTLTPPEQMDKELTPEQIEAFKVMARKELSTVAKLRILFTDTSYTNAQGEVITTHAPRIELGGGYGQENIPDAGKGTITKYVDHLRLSYIASTGREVAVVLGENGGELIGFDIKGGGGGGTLLSINLSNQSKYSIKYVEGEVLLGIERDTLGRITKITPSNGTPFTITY